MPSNEETALAVTRTDAVAEIVLEGPPGNALGPGFFEALPRVLAELDAQSEVRAVVLRAKGDHFSVGVDIARMVEAHGLDPRSFGPSARKRQDLRALVASMQDAVGSIERCRKPVIAAVHGMCAGAALEVAAACDLRLCSKDARFALIEVKRAVVPDLGGLQRLLYLIGPGNLRELAYLGKNIGADRAERIGLVQRVAADRDALVAEAGQMAREIADNAPLAVQGIKHVINHSLGQPVAEGLRYVAAWNAAFMPSLDLEEAILSFRERRRPKFRGD